MIVKRFHDIVRAAHLYKSEKISLTYISNSRIVIATLRFIERELPVLKGGPLHDDSFVFEQLHFHWSEDDHSGCEHIFEDQTYVFLLILYLLFHEQINLVSYVNIRKTFLSNSVTTCNLSDNRRKVKYNFMINQN